MRTRALVFLPAALVPLAVLVASISRTPVVLPITAAAVCYPVLVRFLLRGRPGSAVVATLLWAVSLSASIICATVRDAGGAATWVLHGTAYRDEMFAFIATGHGREGDPSRFIPQHLLHLAGFALLALASAGLLGIVLGAVLVGYMSYYVGALAAAGGAPFTAFMFGWPPYAMLRVVAFVLLGVALARPLLARLAGRPLGGSPGGAFYGAILALLVADVLIKILVAARWASLLRPCLAQP